jgi:CelD/BcsL family acetyltransferase involved in cellulose biosynthesis
MDDWKFELYRGLESIEGNLRSSIWEQIFSDSEDATIFHHPSMILNWYKSFSILRQNEPVVVRGWSDAREAICAFEHTRTGWRDLRARVLTPIGGPFNVDFQDPLVSGSVWILQERQAFWRQLSDFLRLSLPECDRINLYRLRQGYVDGVDGSEESDVSPYLDLEGMHSLDDVLSRCRRSHRGDVCRQIRRLNKKGNVSIRVFGCDEVGPALLELRRFFRAYDHQWAPHGDHMFQTALGRSFLAGLLRDLLPTGFLHFSVLMCHERPIHWHMGFLFRNRLYFYKLTYDRQWANYSPGKVHIALLIDECIRKGVRYFDFLYGGESYKFSWAPTVNKLYRLEWWNGVRPIHRCWEDILQPSYRTLRHAVVRSRRTHE